MNGRKTKKIFGRAMRVRINSCWHWAKRGECNRPAGECKFEHMEATKGIQMLNVKGAKSMGGAASTAVADIVQAALVDGTKGIPNGPVSGTTCIQCGKAPKYCEDGKVHDYCGKACATAAGKYVGKQSTNLGLGSAWRMTILKTPRRSSCSRLAS